MDLAGDTTLGDKDGSGRCSSHIGNKAGSGRGNSHRWNWKVQHPGGMRVNLSEAVAFWIDLTGVAS